MNSVKFKKRARTKSSTIPVTFKFVIQENGIFLKLKKHIAEKTVKSKFDIHCENPANVSAQWPLKAKNIVNLEVKNCKLEHYFRGHSSKTPTNISDELEYLHFEDSMVIIDITDMLNIAGNISNVDKDYDCGHEETFKYYAFKNISYEFKNNASLMSAEKINKVSEMLSKAHLIKHKCIYKNLEYADLSVKRQESKFHLELVTTSSACVPFAPGFQFIRQLDAQSCRGF